MNKKVIAFVAFLLAFSNVYIFLNKSKYTYKKQISYADLYPNVSDISIKELTKKRDSILEFTLTNEFRKPITWYLKLNEKYIDTFAAISPNIKLQNGLNTYVLTSPIFKDSLFSRIEYIPKQSINGKQILPFVGVYKSNIENVSFDLIEGDKNIFDGIKENEKREIKNILVDSIGIKNEMTAKIKVEKICYFLYQKIYSSSGTPTEVTKALNTFQQYRAAAAGQKIWCGIFANIFNVFVASAGVKCRASEIVGSFKNINGSNHVANEYFLPEKKQWVAADLMYNNIRYVNANGRALNLVEVKNTSYNDSTVNILKANSDTVSYSVFSKSLPAFFDMYGKEKELIYYSKTAYSEYSNSYFKRFRNYLLPYYALQNYSDMTIVDNKNFYLKALLGWGFIFFFGAISLFYLINSLKKRR